jgi:hypothetical protein
MSVETNNDAFISRIWDEVEQIQFFDKLVNSESESESDYEYNKPRATSSVMAIMPCGDVHVCKVGKFCPFMELSKDKLMVCLYTGLEHGPQYTHEFFDLNGGNGKKSADPDQNSGNMMYSKFSNKRIDPFLASRMALQSSIGLDDDATFGHFAYYDDKLKSKNKPKRSALCVGESSTTTNLNSKRANINSKTFTQLQAEAEFILIKLLNHKCSPKFQKCVLDTNNNEYMFKKTLTKYIKACLISNVPPNFDQIHNLSLLAKKRSTNIKSKTTKMDLVNLNSYNFRSICTSLIIALWYAICTTPYMINSKKGTNLFRPFVCGALYAFKRGISLQNGITLIPQCLQIANTLPVLRSTGCNKSVKMLQSSSHKGLCTISRSIASVKVEDQQQVFNNVSIVAKQFVNTVMSNF